MTRKGNNKSASELQKQFWNEFGEFVKTQTQFATLFSFKDNNACNWLKLTSHPETEDWYIALKAEVKGKGVGVDLVIPDSKELYNLFKTNKDAIERSIHSRTRIRTPETPGGADRQSNDDSCSLSPAGGERLPALEINWDSPHKQNTSTISLDYSVDWTVAGFEREEAKHWLVNTSIAFYHVFMEYASTRQNPGM